MTVLTTANAFPGMPFPQHKSGQSAVQSYLYPGAVLPNPNAPPPSVLSYTNAFPNLAYPQHKAAQSAVQSFPFPGAVQPAVNSQVAAFMIFSQQTISIPLLMTVPVSVTLHNP